MEDVNSEVSQVCESDPDVSGDNVAGKGAGKGQRKKTRAKARPKANAKRPRRLPPSPCAQELSIKADATCCILYRPFSAEKPLGEMSSWASGVDGKQMFSITCRVHTKCSRACGGHNYGGGSKLVQWLLDGVTLAGDPRLDGSQDHKGLPK